MLNRRNLGQYINFKILIYIYIYLAKMYDSVINTTFGHKDI